MAVRDPDTEWLRVQIYRRMTPQERMWIAAQMYEDGVATVRAAILDRQPNLTPPELQREVRRRLLPRDLFEKVEAALAERMKADSLGKR
ncbi:MAG: hypothetical protein R3A44_18835 [Caldilineaceae bacterium]